MKKLCFFLFLGISFQTLFAQINPENIKIVRDKWGVPHIYAKTDAEVSYGLAWANAEDDFKTMQLTLLAGKGMVGQLRGKDGATIDYVVALLRCREVVDEQYDKVLSPEYKALIEGYVAGINAYAAKHPEEVLVKGSFPTNTKEYTTSTVLSLSMISGVDGVLQKIFNGNIKTLDEFKAAGSNAIAISSSKTVDGSAYLAINPHQPLEGPVAWYEAHLCSEEGLNVLGALFPGGPVIFVGVNENLGWTHTVNYQDKVDVFQLEMNPNNKKQYKFDGKWETLEEKTVKLKVKMKGFTIPVKKVVLWSKYGATIQTKQGTFSIRFSANQDIRGIEQWYKMDKARNFSEFYKAMQMTAIPGFNTIYADKRDTIFYVSNGKIPFRTEGYDWKNTIPGNTSKTLWTSFHPLKDLPQYVNPTSGYLFNANHTPYNATGVKDNLKAQDFDQTMGYETKDNNRSIRFQEMFSQYDKISFDDFKRIKYDGQLPQGKLYFPANTDELFKLNPSEYPDIQTLIENLNQWNRKTNVDSKGAAIFLVMLNYFTNELSKKGEIANYEISKEETIAAFRYVNTYMNQHFGRTDISLGDLQKLVRGNIEKPSWGLPDVITAMHTRPYKEGKLNVVQGESYIGLIKFPKEGLPEIETVLNFGQSTHVDSPHFADQMDLYLSQKTKKMTLDKTEVMKTAVKTYSPK
ncbi:Glutaryl-7-aminocephalosporanic-acid acylase [Emticicia aquatica]|uniref:Glutaryl-7-aminocephalosporanic-acid acylase n=1 Tax=Emticicia aquatica TaxID=1681835 RepID=A0ABN8EXS4_9BACT|nr:acylase [Emticicia aquatica]CAH0996623.1 Glutaryl-7-aminocephalosporanic-acid acylase [Emticicia aquatica]